jgi:hypothetical protein
LVSSKYHSGVFGGKRGVENDVVKLKDPFRVVVNFIVSLKQDAVPVREVKTTQ